ncbi:hypothetical protein SDC9_186287 [bioreactor metagenome]|uniref:Uncharacterized protein n=1 Tax=bioreactor metagenome TaxID=1076179 RepID=A0A645HK51_9ZZZZ
MQRGVLWNREKSCQVGRRQGHGENLSSLEVTFLRLLCLRTHQDQHAFKRVGQLLRASRTEYQDFLKSILRIRSRLLPITEGVANACRQVCSQIKLRFLHLRCDFSRFK